MRFPDTPLLALPRKPNTMLASWLSDRASLTKRLKAIDRKGFSVTLLNQAWQKAPTAYATRLKNPLNQWVCVRDVLLNIHGTPVVFARSYLTQAATTAEFRRLRVLKQRALGEVLFKSTLVSRSRIRIRAFWPETFAHLLPPHLLTDARVWGRQSIFQLPHGVIAVEEFFLPTFTPFMLKTTRRSSV